MKNIVNLNNIANIANQSEYSWNQLIEGAINNIKELCERSNNFSENIKRLNTIFSEDKIKDYSLLQIIRLENLFDEVITQLENNSDAKSALNGIKDLLLTRKPQKIKEIKDKVFSENRNDIKVDEDIQGYFLEILKKNIEGVEVISFLNFIPTKQQYDQKIIAAESPIDENKITILYCGEEFNGIKLPDGYYFAHQLGFDGNPYAWVLKDIHTLYEKMYYCLKDQQKKELGDLMNKHGVIKDNIDGITSISKIVKLLDAMLTHGVIKDNIDGITSISKIVKLLDAMLTFHLICAFGTVYNGDYSAGEDFKQIHQEMLKFVSDYNYLIQTEPKAVMFRSVGAQPVANEGLDGFAPAEAQAVMPRSLVDAQPVANGGSDGDASKPQEFMHSMPRSLVGAQPEANGGLGIFLPAKPQAFMPRSPAEPKAVMFRSVDAQPFAPAEAQEVMHSMHRSVGAQPVANGVSDGGGSSSKYKIGKVIFTVLFAISGLACLAMVVLSKQILNTAIAKIFNSNLFIAIFSVFCAFAMVAIICNIPVVNKAIQASLSVKRDVGNINSKALKI